MAGINPDLAGTVMDEVMRGITLFLLTLAERKPLLDHMITGILFLVIGLVMLILAINTFLRYKKVSRIGITTEGIVEATVDDANIGSASRYRYPVIRFTTGDGTSITRTYKVGTPRNTYQQGSKVSIVYDPNNPTDFFIKSSFSTNGLIVLAVFSIFILIIGILLYLHIKLPFASQNN
jgi:hypothetical protein